MAHAAGDALDFPVYGSHYLVTFPILDADGDPVTGATGLDSEVSKDLGTFTDCTNEATELATNSGIYYLYLTGAEMTAKIVTVRIQTSSGGAKTTVLSISPRRLSIQETGTAQGGGGSTITLASGASASDSYYNGWFVRVNNNSPAGAQYATRRILSYVGSTRVATVESAWGTNPDNSSTYDLMVEVVANVGGWLGVSPASPATAGIPDVNMKNIANAAVSTSTAQIGVNVVNFGGSAGTFASGRPEVNTSHAAGTAWNSGAIGANTLATDTITAAKIAADAIGASELAADAVTEIQSGLSTLTAAGVRSAVGLASANLDTQLAAIAGYIDTEVATIISNIAALPTANQTRDAVFAQVIGYGTTTFAKILTIIAAAAAGKTSGQETGLPVFRDIDDTRNVISGSMDSNKNRIAITLNP